MKIPEAHICDAAGCTEDVRYRITHEVLLDPPVPGEMVPGRDWHQPSPAVFEFCDKHSYGFDIGGRGSWSYDYTDLKPGVPSPP
jgi:hypothetical protein